MTAFALDFIVQTCCLTITLATHSRKNKNTIGVTETIANKTDRFTKSKQLTIDTSAPAVAPWSIPHHFTVSFFCSSSCTSLKQWHFPDLLIQIISTKNSPMHLHLINPCDFIATKKKSSFTLSLLKAIWTLNFLIVFPDDLWQCAIILLNSE